LSKVGKPYKKTVELKKGTSGDITSTSLVSLTNPASTEDFTVDKATFDASIATSASNVTFDDTTINTGSNNVQGALDVVGAQAFFARYGVSTGWLSGGEVTPVADPAKFDLAAGTGLLVNAQDPTNITAQSIAWTAKLNSDPQFLATNAVSFLAINSSGALVQSATFPVEDEFRDVIQMGAVVHGDNTTINGFSDFLSAVPYQIAPSLTDLTNALGVIQLAGNDFTGSGNENLKFQKSAGKDFFFGIQAKAFPNNPNIILNILQVEPNITFSWRDGSGGFNTKLTDAVTAGVFDDGTGGATDPQGTVTTNNFVNIRIKYSPDADTIFFEYGDATHNNSATAVDNLEIDSYGDNPSFAGVPIRAYVSLRGAALNTDIVGDAVFTQTNKFGIV